MNQNEKVHQRSLLGFDCIPCSMCHTGDKEFVHNACGINSHEGIVLDGAVPFLVGSCHGRRMPGLTNRLRW